jgi:choline dehydrogenase-like flavoprotein
VPFLDLDSGPFDIHVDHDESDALRVRMTRQVCQETGVQITRTVTITICFGNDPKTSTLDRNCKAHEVDNLYVVDASFFPSSGAVNPALTIMANALRVGDHLIERLGAKAQARKMVGAEIVH